MIESYRAVSGAFQRSLAHILWLMSESGSPPLNTQPGYPQGDLQQPGPERPWFKKKRFVIPIGTFVAFGVIGALAPDDDKAAKVADPVSSSATTIVQAEDRAAASQAATAVSEQTTTAPQTVAPAPKKVSQQDQFIALVVKAREAADDADNDFQKRLPLTNRNKAICKLLKSKKVSNWTGEVTTLDTNGDGLGVLGIEVADDIQVSTWNNAVSDFEDHTLIKTDSPVFNAMATLNEGDQVTFTGTFTRDSSNCIGEQSLTDNGSTQTPTFTMRFSRVAKA